MKNALGHGSNPRGKPVMACECGDHVFVALAPWGCTIASPEDAELLGSRSWQIRVEPGNLYAEASKAGRPRALHRIINQTPDGLDTDHVGGNGLDNRRPMLRTASRAQNIRNRHAKPRSVSGFRGVTWHRCGLWRAYVHFQGKQISAGYHATTEQAAAARDALLRKLLPQEIVSLNNV